MSWRDAGVVAVARSCRAGVAADRRVRARSAF